MDVRRGTQDMWRAPRAVIEDGIVPQAARHYGRLPAVKHGFALRAVSLRDGCGFHP